MEKLFNTKQAAEYFNVSIPTIRSWKDKGMLKYVKIGKLVYFKQTELERFINSREMQKAAV